MGSPPWFKPTLALFLVDIVTGSGGILVKH
jgi:hypothetical protein